MSKRVSHGSSAHKQPSGASPAPTGQCRDAISVSEDVIAKRAFEKFMARGCAHGLDQEDWVLAIQELSSESSSVSAGQAKTTH